jgi:hypothetical protein
MTYTNNTNSKPQNAPRQLLRCVRACAHALSVTAVSTLIRTLAGLLLSGRLAPRLRQVDMYRCGRMENTPISYTGDPVFDS